MLNSDDLKKII